MGTFSCLLMVSLALLRFWMPSKSKLTNQQGNQYGLLKTTRKHAKDHNISLKLAKQPRKSADRFENTIALGIKYSSASAFDWQPACTS